MISGTLSAVGTVQAELNELAVLNGNLTRQAELLCALNAIGCVSAVLAGVQNMSCELSLPKGKASDPYTGDYDFIPSQELQTIPIAGLKATQNITIEPIPQNYGLITWNGSTITVS